MEDLIANDAMIVTLSHRGYIKRTPASEYRLQGRGGKGLKGMETKATGKDEADDFVEHLFSRPGARLPAVLHQHRPHVCRARV